MYLISLCACRSRNGWCAVFAPNSSDSLTWRPQRGENFPILRPSRASPRAWITPPLVDTLSARNAGSFCCKHRNANNIMNQKKNQVQKPIRTSNASVSRIYKSAYSNPRENPSMNSYDGTGRCCPQSPDPLIRLIKYSGSYKRAARARHEGSVRTRMITEESIYDEFRLICTHKFADLDSLHVHFICG